MRILVLSQYFWPESFIINDIVRVLDEQGHQVVVATGKPNYPDGEVFEGYRAGGMQREPFLGSIEVVRTPIWPRGRGGAKNLMLNYVSFVLSGILCFPWLLRQQRFDAILVFAPSPILQAIPAIPLKWLKRAKLALWVQDLWPESLAATGYVTNRHALTVVGWLVKGIYHCCDTLLVQSRAFFEPVSRYAPAGRIVYFPNSMDVRAKAVGVPIPVALIDQLASHFCVLFAGNFGKAQSLNTLLQAAAQLRGVPEFRLVLVGSGSQLAWVESQLQEQGLENVILAGRFPMEVMPAIFERAAALLVSLTSEEIFAQTIPSKIQAYLAAGRPILASLNGEGARVIQESGAGFVSPAEQAGPLVENIRQIMALNVPAREAMGRAGREYFDANFEMNMQVRKLEEILS
ncbi:glycosyltransferase family 4 protein [Azonexus sp.]|jgi:glycosyltransferase involved in cell wall biosynthesis|uniref:glycosyltransferase family 4 protein n=1 Tax=Azonexus sp. TaxID=1872668 RepID=UPI00281DC690|nr:glycosyltransferase family 4 protein [Azonexus sp.]MDR1995917.1 glycosyltransferase family 4 protein [Azonexus sp.]